MKREREAEGNEFDDKEKFVTAAYKQRQEELRRLEEEKRLEGIFGVWFNYPYWLLLEQKAKSQDMTGFYRSVLDMKARQIQVNVSVTPIDSNQLQDEEEPTSVVEKERAELLIKAGVVRVNESNEIVDKRELLSAGLNVSSRKIKQLKEEKEHEEQERIRAAEVREAELRDREAREEKRLKAMEEALRAREYVQKQKEERDRFLREKMAAEKEELAKKLERKVDEAAISDARARYLNRKKLKTESSDEESD